MVWFHRISLTDDKFRAIKPLIGIGVKEYRLYLGRSEKGVYCALGFGSLTNMEWKNILDRRRQMEWVLKHHNNFNPMLPRPNYDPQVRSPWILQDINYAASHKDDDVEALVEEKF